MGINSLDIEELACHIVNLDYDEIDADTEIIEEQLIEIYGCDLEQFAALITELLPLIDVGQSGLTETRYKGFANVENNIWFVKTKI